MSAELGPLSIFTQHIVSFFFICCLPGLALSYLLFSPARLDKLERLWIAFSSSIALSSLLASGLIIILGQFSPMNFITGILILTIGFASAALWGIYLTKNTLRSFISFVVSIKFSKQLLLVAVLFIFLLFARLVEFPGTANQVDDLSASVPSGITEFYISPGELENILEDSIGSSSEIEIPLVIVNHNPGSMDYQITIINNDQNVYEKGGITVSSGDSWRGNVVVPRMENTSSPYFDIFLYANSNQVSVAQLRLWK